MVKATYLKNIRVMEFYALITNVKDYIQAENLETLKLKEAFDNDFLPAYEAFDGSLVGMRKSGYTHQISELETKRNAIIIGFNGHLRAYEKFPDPATVEAAKRVKNIVDGFGKYIQTLGLSQKLGVTINLVDELSKAEVKKDVQKIGATLWIDELKTLNDEVQRLFKERIKFESSIETGKVKDSREQMQKSFTDFCKRINALALLEGSENYQKLSDNINREVERAKQIAKGRNRKGTIKEDVV